MAALSPRHMDDHRIPVLDSKRDELVLATIFEFMWAIESELARSRRDATSPAVVFLIMRV